MTHRPAVVRTDSPRYLTEDRLAIRDLARDFAMTRVLPVANELDPVRGTIPGELKKSMGEIGFFGIMIPEEYGGLVCRN
jgi:butyryl-CoA dehydrogenase